MHDSYSQHVIIHITHQYLIFKNVIVNHLVPQVGAVQRTTFGKFRFARMAMMMVGSADPWRSRRVILGSGRAPTVDRQKS
jgi:hypothetical protein